MQNIFVQYIYRLVLQRWSARIKSTLCLSELYWDLTLANPQEEKWKGNTHTEPMKWDNLLWFKSDMKIKEKSTPVFSLTHIILLSCPKFWQIVWIKNTVRGIQQTNWEWWVVSFIPFIFFYIAFCKRIKFKH